MNQLIFEMWNFYYFTLMYIDKYTHRGSYCRKASVIVIAGVLVAHWPLTDPSIWDFLDRMFRSCKQEDSSRKVEADYGNHNSNG